MILQEQTLDQLRRRRKALQGISSRRYDAAKRAEHERWEAERELGAVQAELHRRDIAKRDNRK